MSENKEGKTIDENRAPVFEALSCFSADGRLSFHMPGIRQGFPFYSPYDITELPESDDLNDPGDPIKEAERLASKAFGSEEIRFLTEGSSQGIYAVLSAIAGDGGKIALPRASHRAFLYGAERFSCDVVFVRPGISGKKASADESGASPLYYPSLDDYESVLKRERNVKLVSITAPDYYGFIPDFTGLRELCHKYGALLFLDAAHGAHLSLLGLMDFEADIWVSSAHKTLPAPTPAAFLGMNASDFKASENLYSRMDKALKVLRGSSPPLYIAAAADEARRWTVFEGGENFRRQLQNIEKLRNSLADEFQFCTPDFEGCFDRNSRLKNDPMRIIIRTPEYIEGETLLSFLEERFIDAEFADRSRLVLIPSLASEEKDYALLAKALDEAEIDLKKRFLSEKILPGKAENQEDFFERLSGMKGHGKDRILGKELHESLRKRLSGKDCAADGDFTPYPPGIPYYWPGERNGCGVFK